MKIGAVGSTRPYGVQPNELRLSCGAMLSLPQT